jgi:hypothetical protein
MGMPQRKEVPSPNDYIEALPQVMHSLPPAKERGKKCKLSFYK